MPEPTPASLRIAVLMDSDNVSPKFAPLILEELATYGTPTIKRAYGDWTTTNLNGWKKALNHHAIQPVQQFAYTVGKNSSDSALIIDAMDLLWMGNVDAFALVSSDSDFTRLATRLREGGKRVIGLGARKTPASLRNAVDQFIYLELLGTATDHDVDDDETGEDAPAKEENAKASEGSGRSGSRRGGRGRGRGAGGVAERLLNDDFSAQREHERRRRRDSGGEQQRVPRDERGRTGAGTFFGRKPYCDCGDCARRPIGHRCEQEEQGCSDHGERGGWPCRHFFRCRQRRSGRAAVAQPDQV